MKQEFLKYLQARRKTMMASIKSEQLAGNSVKELCEKTALAEVDAMEFFLHDWRNSDKEPGVVMNKCNVSGCRKEAVYMGSNGHFCEDHC